MKATAIAPANIAFIKYWGRIDDKLILPANSSISMNLSNCLTTATVEFSPKYSQDTVSVDFDKGKKEILKGEEKKQVCLQLDRIRNIAKVPFFSSVASKNNFPAGIGIASSASAFAALTLAAVRALELSISQKELTILTRLSGFGSSCRSIPDGFVKWYQGASSASSFAKSIFPPRHWEIVDIVVILGSKEKEVSSKDGHKLASTSPFFRKRLEKLPLNIKRVEDALKAKDIHALGEAIEEEAISLHSIAMTSKPPLYYWEGKTIELIKSIRVWQDEGIKVYFTLDAGPTVHMICEEKEKKRVIERLKNFAGIEKIIINKPAEGARVINEHLF